MKNNIILKFIIVILVGFILLNYIPTSVKASSFIENAIHDGKGFLETPTDQTIRNSVDGSQIIFMSKDIFNLLVTIGIILAAVVITVLGIQFMTGSIEQKAKVKEMLVPFGVGCVIIFGALGIWRLIVSIASGILK